MLKSVDILLGLTVVMLLVSLAVTVLTEALSNLLQTRGRHLLNGISGLLRQIHRELDEETSGEIAKAILTHPLIKSAGSRYGTVIHREELTALMLELASTDGVSSLKESARAELSNILKKNGIDDPAKVMANVRSLTLLLEQIHPELSNNERYAAAFLQEASSSLLAKINGWFDQTIDRVSDRFTNSARIITFVCSFAVALFLQLDTPSLVNRLSADPAFRQALVQDAIKLDTQGASKPQSTKAGSEAALLPKLSDQDRQNLETLTRFDVIQTPASLAEWTGRWTVENWLMKLLGILLTSLLLSLGAPFWYNALKNLIRLRSLIAQKDDDQRLSRQTNNTPIGTATASGVTSLVVTGERGDLTSLG